MQNKLFNIRYKKIYIFNDNNFEEKTIDKIEKSDIIKITDNNVLYTTEDNPSGIWIVVSVSIETDFDIFVRPFVLAKDYKIERWIK